MAKRGVTRRKRKKGKRKVTRSRGKSRRTTRGKGHVPLKILMKRAKKLNAIVESRAKNPRKWA